MTYNDIVLYVLRTAGRPLASHELFELPDCEGMTRQQVSSAVGHLRRAGKIKETWGTVPGPLHGPKWVRQYEVMPQEEGLDEALIAALHESAGPGDASQDAPGVTAEADTTAEAVTEPESTTGPEKPDIGDMMLGILDDLATRLSATPNAALQPETEQHQCCGKCLGPDQGKPAIYAGQGGPCAVHAVDDQEDTSARPDAKANEIKGDSGANDAAPARSALPSWVADLQAWLGPLPAGMLPYKLASKYSSKPCGELRIKAFDDGNGAYIVINAQALELDAGETGALSRYADALILILDAMAANAVDVPGRYRPTVGDKPNPHEGWESVMDQELAPLTAADSMPW